MRGPERAAAGQPVYLAGIFASAVVLALVTLRLTDFQLAVLGDVAQHDHEFAC